MNRLIVGVAVGLILYASSFAASPKSYQVTGPIVSISDSLIVVQKGKENWEIARAADTKVTGDLKVGDKVTIVYTMKAAKIDVKADAKAEVKTDAKIEKAAKTTK